MKGIERRRIRRRPMASIRKRERRVNSMFAIATESEVNVGVEKASIEKSVAEKYIREFCSLSV